MPSAISLPDALRQLQWFGVLLSAWAPASPLTQYCCRRLLGRRNGRGGIVKDHLQNLKRAAPLPGVSPRNGDA
jgi:hypothetical protein